MLLDIFVQLLVGMTVSVMSRVRQAVHDQSLSEKQYMVALYVLHVYVYMRVCFVGSAHQHLLACMQ